MPELYLERVDFFILFYITIFQNTNEGSKITQ